MNLPATRRVTGPWLASRNVVNTYDYYVRCAPIISSIAATSTVMAEKSLESLLSQSENHCCCGQQNCAFLKHTNSALEGLEKDILSAAQIGSNLLIRHETHMAEAEAERIKMLESIEKLELDKKRLESSNAAMIDENRKLLHHLEEINDAVSQSDCHIRSLTATLQSTRQELQRLTILAGRTAQLEAQLTNMEVDYAGLESQFVSSEMESRTALQRWKRAEGTIAHLQTQIDLIEKEAKEERERHVEILGRMERQMAVEKELANPVGQLRGAAAARSLHCDSSTNVVAHFVKDILQNNTNLQLDVVELREMLMGSNAEVENLREQLLLHQPLQSDFELGLSPVLSTEINQAEQHISEIPPAVHVHHHYHVPEVARKLRKKRAVITPGHFSTSATSIGHSQKIKEWRAATPPSSVAKILSQTSVTVPPKRWSIQSARTCSSLGLSSRASSPQATSSIFDNIDNAFGSGATSPESSVAWGSPPKVGTGFHQKQAHRAISSPAPFKLGLPFAVDSTEPDQPAEDGFVEDSGDLKCSESLSPNTARCNNPTDLLHSPGHETIVEEDENDAKSTTISFIQDRSNRPSLRRATSHEVLLSFSDMDIHTLRGRPSQVFRGRAITSQSPYSPTIASLASTSAAVSPTTATSLRPSQRQDSSEYTRSILAQAYNNEDMRQSLTKRMGEWMWNKREVVSIHSVRSQIRGPSGGVLRSPGVNQFGPIRGLKSPEAPPPSNVEPETVDRALLEESLVDV